MSSHPALVSRGPVQCVVPARFFIVNPTSVEGGLTKAHAVAKAADVFFNPGSWMRPVSLEIPENQADAQAVREMLQEESLSFWESPVDLAAY